MCMAVSETKLEVSIAVTSSRVQNAVAPNLCRFKHKLVLNSLVNSL